MDSKIRSEFKKEKKLVKNKKTKSINKNLIIS